MYKCNQITVISILKSMSFFVVKHLKFVLDIIHFLMF